MTITIHATKTELTDSIREHAEKKVRSLEKYFDRIVSAAVDVGLESTHHQKGKIYYAEVNLHLPGGKMIRVTKNAEDLYKAIEKVKDHLKVELTKLKEKMRDKDRDEVRSAKGYQDGE